jgi:hypothetical protein
MIERISLHDYARGIAIEAFTDGYSYDEYGYLCLMSILGHDSAVKAISAGIVSLKEVTIQQKRTWASYSGMPGEKYRIMSTRLASGLLHQIVAIDSLLTQANNKRGLIYVGTSEDINRVVFNKVKKDFGTPLLPEWKDQLIRQFETEELIDLMQGNVRTVRLTLTEKQLDSIISEGVRQRSLRF